MSLTIGKLIEKNKDAYKNQFYIESVNLSYILIVKALRQITKEERLQTDSLKTTLNDYVKALKPYYDDQPLFKRKLKKSVYKDISEFCGEQKQLMKEIKFQFPETKLSNTAKRGMNIIINLNTTLVKMKHNG